MQVYTLKRDVVLSILSPAPDKEVLEESLRSRGFLLGETQSDMDHILKLALYYGINKYPSAPPQNIAAFASLITGHTTGLFPSFGSQCDALEEEAEEKVITYLGGVYDRESGMAIMQPGALDKERTIEVFRLFEEILLKD